jgi:hypothetical protein
MSDTKIRDDVEHVSLDEILPYGENPKTHPDEQIEKIASSIKRFGWDQPIVVDGNGTIIKGHGRYRAAQRLGLDDVPVIYATDLSEAEVRASRVADNRVAESDWDDELLGVELELIDESPLDLDAAGFDDDELIDINDDLGPDDLVGDDSGVEYTDKIETPEYTPTQDEPPSLSELYDTERYEELTEAIDESGVSGELEQFLRFAAQRHIIFDYENIAEYFAHQDDGTQQLMELLTLVIVDYDMAIEQGFTQFTEDALEGVRHE